MSDERLREAERRWRETGAVEDEARYLLERVRVGELSRAWILAGAYLGDAGCRLALGDDPCTVMSTSEGAIVPGQSVGPFRLGTCPDDFRGLEGARREQRHGYYALHTPNVVLTVDERSHRVVHVLARGAFEGSFLGIVRPGVAYSRLVEVAGPTYEDEEDSLLLRRYPNIGVVVDGPNDESPVTAIYVFS